MPTLAPISCTHNWSRYFTLSDAADGSDMLVDRLAIRRLHARCQHPRARCEHINGSTPADHIRHRHPSEVIVRREVLTQYDLAHAAASAGRVFTWSLDHYFFYWTGALLPRGLHEPLRPSFFMQSEHDRRVELSARSGNGTAAASSSSSSSGDGGSGGGSSSACASPEAGVDRRMPLSMRALVARFAAVIGHPLEATFGIHLRVEPSRRGVCDTSAAGVARWLACARHILPPALPDEPRTVEHILRRGFPSGVHFVVFTNDNASVANELTTELRKLAGPSGGAHAGDEILRELLLADFNATGNDNFMVMQAIHAIFFELPAAIRIGYHGHCLRFPHHAEAATNASSATAHAWPCNELLAVKTHGSA